jgi:translation initiation factor 3 subunit B
LEEYSRTFDEDDAAEESNVSAELITLRKRLVDEWNAWRALCIKEFSEDRLLTFEKSRELKEGKEEIDVWIDQMIDHQEAPDDRD